MTTIQKKTHCRICLSACGLVAEVEGDQVLSVRGDRDHPLSGGYSCSKGRGLPEFHRSPQRLLAPKVKRYGQQVEVSWDEVLGDLEGKLKKIIAESGPQAIGVYMGAGGFFDGPLYITGRSMAAFIGSPHSYSTTTIDVIPKVATGVLMADLPLMLPQPDFAACRFLLYLGSNPLVSHGQAATHSNPTKLLRDVMAHAEVWVVDPRRTETASKATRHLVARPGSDHAILAFLVREILREGADQDFIAQYTQGVDQLAEAVAPFDLAEAARLSGLDAAELTDLLASIRRNGRIAIETGTGVSMSSTGGVVHWLSLALMAITGSLDREGGVWFNPGFHTQAHKRNLPSAWPEGNMRPGPASRPELTSWVGEYPTAAMSDEIEAGNLRALFNLGGGLVESLPQTARITAALGSMEVLASLDVVENATTRLSTHVLPVKHQFERMDVSMSQDFISPAVAMSFTEAVVPPPPGVRSAWWVLAQIGKRIGYDLTFGIDPDTASDEDYVAHLVSGCPTTMSELKEKRYVVAEPPVFGWFLKRAVANGGLKLAPEALIQELASLNVPDAPLLMISRRLHPHFNSRIYPARDKEMGGIFLHPVDAEKVGLGDGSRAVVRSAHGALEGFVRIDDTLSPGVMNVPHGFADINVNVLTSGADVNALTGMPTFSALPVTVEPA